MSTLVRARIQPALGTMDTVGAAMAEISDNDSAGTAGTSLHELLGEAWLSVATQYILKQSRLKALLKEQEATRKRRRGGWHPKPRQYLFWQRSPHASPAELWEHDHSNCKLWRWLQTPSGIDDAYEEKQFADQFGLPRPL